MDNLDLTDLKLVKYIVEEGSLSNATEKMYRTQSALSHKLKEIEKALGFPIFSRRSKRLFLTDNGKLVFSHAEKILSLVEEMKKAVADAKTAKTERIRLITACYTSYHWLPAIIKKFKTKHPDVVVEVKTEGTRNPFPYIESGQLDVAIADHAPGVSSRFKMDVLFEDEFVLLVSRDSKYAKIDRLSSKDLHGADLIMFDMPETQSTALNQYFKPMGVPLNSITKMQLTEGIIEMVAADLGIAILPTWIVAPYLKNSLVRQFKLPSRTVRRKWYAVTHKDATMNQRHFIKLIQGELKTKR